MSRAERLLDLADRLRGLAETSVGALAAEMEVSPRTVLRDLAALRDRGMPITGQSGPGGGIRMEGSRGLTAVHLSIAEVIAIWLATSVWRIRALEADPACVRCPDDSVSRISLRLPCRDVRTPNAMAVTTETPRKTAKTVTAVET